MEFSLYPSEYPVRIRQGHEFIDSSSKLVVGDLYWWWPHSELWEWTYEEPILVQIEAVVKGKVRVRISDLNTCNEDLEDYFEDSLWWIGCKDSISYHHKPPQENFDVNQIL